MFKLIATLVTVSLVGCVAVPDQAFLSNPRVFSCSPEAVLSGDTLLLFKNSHELRELAVQRPRSGTSHFLVVDMPPPEMRPLMSPEQLADSTNIRIVVGKLTGLEWREGAVQEPIFTVSGTYVFILSSVLESEEYAYMCRVQFQPVGKRANNSFNPMPLRGTG